MLAGSPMPTRIPELGRLSEKRRVSLRNSRGIVERPDPTLERPASHAHVLQVVQPGLLGLMDGSVSTLAPLFATATLTGRTESAFLVGLAASVGAGISMGLAEALSDDGEISGRGKPLMRGVITGGGTVIGGMLHTLPFLLSNLQTALWLGDAVVGVRLIAISFLRYRWVERA